MGPEDLQKVLSYLPKVSHPALLVGIEYADDAGVFKLSADLALVQSVDYFTPIVDEPYAYGAIAAANSLSDIYAMGARPLTALNLVSYPVKQLPPEVLGEILRGGVEKLSEAGVVIVGGHTIDDTSLKYGVAVTGIIHPDRIVTNAGAKPGDVLILTKPIGTGIIAQGIKADKSVPEAIADATESMMILNKAASEAMVQVGVSACTDVTGFGLIGHLREMLVASGVGARIHFSAVPLLPTVMELAEQGVLSGGARANRRAAEGYTVWDDEVPEAGRAALCDPQTSGGLLIAVGADKCDLLLNALHDAGVTTAAHIGEITSDEGKIRVVP